MKPNGWTIIAALFLVWVLVVDRQWHGAIRRTEQALRLAEQRKGVCEALKHMNASGFTEPNEQVELIGSVTADPNDPNITFSITDFVWSTEIVALTSEEYDEMEYEEKWRWITEDALRRLCQEGRVCAVLGHQWQYDPGVAPGYVFRETCGVCGKEK